MVFKPKLELIILLTLQELKGKFSGTILGFWWYLIWGIINIIIYTIIFSKIMQIKLPNIHYTYSYGIYLALGLIPWNMFAAILMREAYIFLEKRELIKKTSVPLYYFPLVVLVAEYIIFLIQYLMLMFIIFLLGLKINVLWLLITLVISLLLALFGFSLGIFVAIFSIFLKDLQEILKIILNIWFWLTPIVYVMSIIPQKFYFLFELNPIFIFFEIFHSLILKSEFLRLELILYDIGVTLIFILLSVALMKRMESEIRDFI